MPGCAAADCAPALRRDGMMALVRWMRLCAALLALTGCGSELPRDPADERPDPGWPPPPPAPQRGRPEFRAIQAEPGSDRVWFVHRAVADLKARPTVATSHIAFGLPDSEHTYARLDTTGTVGKLTAPLGNGVVFHIARDSDTRDVFALFHYGLLVPATQVRSSSHDHQSFRLSPSRKLILSTEASSQELHLLHIASLSDQPLTRVVASPDLVEWAHNSDVFYVVQADGDDAVLYRYTQSTHIEIIRIPGAPGSGVTLSRDDRFAGFEVMIPEVPGPVLALVSLSSGQTRLGGGTRVEAFTNDHRAVISDGFTSIRLVDPESGTSGEPVALPRFASITALRHRGALIVFPASPEDRPFLYRIADGTRTPLPYRVNPQTMYEHPTRDELWDWSEHDKMLRRIDLATGAGNVIAIDVEAITYRPETDQAILGLTSHRILWMPLDLNKHAEPSIEIQDPNDRKWADGFPLDPLERL